MAVSGSFQNKRAFLTGASSGIGAAVALELARRGARVALAARRLDKLDELRSRIAAAGGEALALECDVRDRASLDAAVAKTAAAWGGIDLCFANAGFGVGGLFVKVSTDDFRRQFETNVFGVIDTLYACLPHLRASQGQAAIVASVAGRLGSPKTSPYASSKFALVGLAESIYPEFVDMGVGLTLVNPGFVDSEIRFLDNYGRRREGAVDPAPGWLVASADKAAREIVRGLERRAPEVVVTAHGKALIFIARHFPRTVRTVLRLSTKGKLRPRN